MVQFDDFDIAQFNIDAMTFLNMKEGMSYDSAISNARKEFQEMKQFEKEIKKGN